MASKASYSKVSKAWDSYAQVIRRGGLRQLIELAYYYKDLDRGFDPDRVGIDVPDQERETARLYKFGQKIGFCYTGRHVSSLLNMAIEIDQQRFVTYRANLKRGHLDWVKIRDKVDARLRATGDLAEALELYQSLVIRPKKRRASPRQIRQ